METAQSNGQTSAPEATAPGQSNQLPSLDDVISSFNNNPDGIETQTTNQEQPRQDIEQDLEQAQEQGTPESAQFEQLKKQELELWKMRKELKEEREALKREREEQSGNQSDFEETLNSLLSNPEDNEDDGDYEREEFDKEAYKKEILEEIENRNRAKEEERESEEIVNNYIQEAKEFTKSRAEDFPMLDGMGKHELIYEALEATYAENARLYGHEKAEEMLPTMEQAAMHVEKHLASELEAVLKSDTVRGYVQKILGMRPSNQESDTQSINSHQSKGQNTLTNSGFTTHSTGVKDSASMNDSEALEHALSFVTLD